LDGGAVNLAAHMRPDRQRRSEITLQMASTAT
jgi:hypothetical protein